MTLFDDILRAFAPQSRPSKGPGGPLAPQPLAGPLAPPNPAADSSTLGQRGLLPRSSPQSTSASQAGRSADSYMTAQDTARTMKMLSGGTRLEDIGIANAKLAERTAAGQRLADAWSKRFGSIDAPDENGVGFDSHMRVWAARHPMYAENVPQLSRKDLDDLVRTVWGEAEGEGPDGQLGVADVVLNRMRETGRTAQQILSEHSQFTARTNAKRRRMYDLKPGDPAYQKILANIAPALAGNDITGGRDGYYAGPTNKKWETHDPLNIAHQTFTRSYAKPKHPSMDPERKLNVSDGGGVIFDD